MIDGADGPIGTGFSCTHAILPALTMYGMADLAEKTFLNRKVPTYPYQVDRGATSIWEHWDALGEEGTVYDPDRNSYNRYAYGVVCQQWFEGVAGVAPAAEASEFDDVRIDRLIVPALPPVQAMHDCAMAGSRRGGCWTTPARPNGRRCQGDEPGGRLPARSGRTQA